MGYALIYVEHRGGDQYIFPAHLEPAIPESKSIYMFALQNPRDFTFGQDDPTAIIGEHQLGPTRRSSLKQNPCVLANPGMLKLPFFRKRCFEL